MEVVDCHAHIFPPLQGACGFADAQTHLLYQQRAMHIHGNQPVRRLVDHQVVREKHLWDLHDPTESGRALDVNFRAGRCGRFEWEKGRDQFYVQFLPPSLQEMSMPAEALVAQMDYAGIETAVLQNDPIYGNLGAYFAAAAAQFPRRFIGLARVEEAFAYRDEQLEVLHDSVGRLGLQGLYFTLASFFRSGYKDYFDAPVFRPFWDAVSALDIPVFWVFLGDSPLGGWTEEMALFLKWLDRYPNISSVLVHGIPTDRFADDKDRIQLPDSVVEAMENYPVYAEILYPIGWGGKTDFPYARAQEHVQQLYQRFGPDRLLWGSDMPNVERFCTYRQSLMYLQTFYDFMAPEDRAKILGGNARSLFKRP